MGFRRRIRDHLWTLSDLLFRHTQWNIGVVDAPIHTFLGRDSRPQVDWFPPNPKGHYRADPFGIVRNGAVAMLCEDYEYRSRRGEIVSWDLSDRAHPVRSEAVIRLPVHASYPFLLDHEGSIYCVPEMHQAREVRLYQASRFPREWIHAATLLRGVAAIDPTPFEHEGRWWLAATDADRGQHDWLCLWHARDLHGPWEPHAANPVKVDPGSARPGGTPFRYRDALYRPAQDCTRIYGGRIVINRIDRLTPTEFRETRVATVEPDPNGPYPVGLHTISQVGSLTFVDGCRFILDPSDFKRGLREEVNVLRESTRRMNGTA